MDNKPEVNLRARQVLTNPVFWLWITLLLYVIIQIFTLGARTLDGDEGVILHIISSSNWTDFWARIGTDVHPPLYHALAKISVSIFGLHEWSVRLPAAVAGGALIPLGWWLGKKLWTNRWKALAFGTMFGLVPYLFFFHQEARFYSLLLVGAVLTYGALISLIKKQSFASWAIFAIGALILVWSQYLGWFILGMEFIFVLLMRQWKMAGWGLVVFALLVLSYIPYIGIAFGQFSGRLSEQGGWLVGDNVIGLVNALYRFGSDRLVLGIAPSELFTGGWLKIVLFVISLVIPLWVMVYGINRRQEYKVWRRLAWTMVALSIILALAVSEIGGRSVRYLVYLWPFYGALVVAGIWRLSKKSWGRVVVALLVLVWVVALGRHIFIENRSAGSRDIAIYLEENATEGDAILARGALAAGEKANLEFYYTGKADIIDYHGDYKPGVLAEERESSEQIITKLLETHGTIWYYDFTYGTLEEGRINADISKYSIGNDKEEQEINVYRFTKR